MAGGMGARMRPLSYYIQKCMVPIGRRQLPLIYYIMSNIAHYGIKRFVILVGYKSEQIINYVDDGSRFGWEVTYVHDEEGYSGTGGSLLRACELGAIDTSEDVLIHYGDILTNLNIGEVVNRHHRLKADALLVLSKDYELPVGVAKLEGDRVVELAEKPKVPIYVTIGVLTLSTRALRLVPELGKDSDLMRDFIPLLINRDYNVHGYVTEDYWYDVGSLDKYEKLTYELIDKMFPHLKE